MFIKNFVEHVNGGFAGLYVQSVEHADCIREILQAGKKRSWATFVWDCNDGLTLHDDTVNPDMTDPLAIVKAFPQMAKELHSYSSKIIILKNFHKFMEGVEVIQAIDNAITIGKSEQVIFVVLAAKVKIPTEIEKQFVVIEHDLPHAEEIEQILRQTAVEPDMLDETEIPRIVESSLGLTRMECENAFSLSIVRQKVVKPDVVWELKANSLKKSGLLQLYKGKESFDTIGGMDNLKTYCKQIINSKSIHARAKGVMLLGISGTGKSQFAKSLGNEMGRPTITMNIGALMGRYVGDTESNTRQAFAQIDKMAPCILFIDEIEKAIAGGMGGDGGDSGVSQRMVGAMLTWMNDHTSDVFMVATCNSITQITNTHPEFVRPGRFNGIFFLDLPSRQQKDMIWDIYERMYKLPKQKRPSDEQWTGAEIKGCCDQACLVGCSLIDAAQYVIPIAITAGEKIAQQREWSRGRALNSESKGIYVGENPQPAQAAKPGRKINRPSDN